MCACIPVAQWVTLAAWVFLPMNKISGVLSMTYGGLVSLPIALSDCSSVHMWGRPCPELSFSWDQWVIHMLGQGLYTDLSAFCAATKWNRMEADSWGSKSQFNYVPGIVSCCFPAQLHQKNASKSINYSGAVFFLLYLRLNPSSTVFVSLVKHSNQTQFSKLQL